MSKKVNHNHQKKIAVINDVTGFGRCSLAVQLPIISKLKIQWSTERLSEKEVSVYAQGKNDFTAKDQTEIQGSWIQSQNGNRRR